MFIGARIKRVAEPQFEGQRVKCIPLIVSVAKSLPLISWKSTTFKKYFRQTEIQKAE